MHDDPAWPPQSTGSGLALRLVHALGRPGRPRRAAVMFLVLLAVPFVGILALVLTS